MQQELKYINLTVGTIMNDDDKVPQEEEKIEPKKLFNMRDYYEPRAPISNHSIRGAREEYSPVFKKAGSKRPGM